jgi:hypothetical protein
MNIVPVSVLSDLARSISVPVNFESVPLRPGSDSSPSRYCSLQLSESLFLAPCPVSATLSMSRNIMSGRLSTLVGLMVAARRPPALRCWASPWTRLSSVFRTPVSDLQVRYPGPRLSTLTFHEIRMPFGAP